MNLGNFFADKKYGEVGFFSKKNPKTREYKYANWGSREWEYFYVEKLLTEIGIKNKQVVDIGIGLPVDADFYKFYIKSGCHLTAFDPDGRLKPVTKLSPRCKIVRSSGEKVAFPSSKADVVVVLSAFEHFPVSAFKKTVKEIHRILKDDGHLIITLDSTACDHKKSARWAILEKTINKLPAEENDLPLPKKFVPLSINNFLKMLESYFLVKDKTIVNSELNCSDLVYSKEWNSCVAYIHLYKRTKKKK